MNKFTISNLPELSGIYLFKDNGKSIIYVGKAKNLKKRVSSYFQKNIDRGVKTDLLVAEIDSLETIVTTSEFEALMLEAKLIHKFQPKYNLTAKDDRSYIYIKITDEEFPRIILARRDHSTKGSTFGPFSSVKIAGEILKQIRNIVPYCNQKREIRRACFYAHLGLCHPCPGTRHNLSKTSYRLLKKQYSANIRKIKLLLDGKVIRLEKELRTLIKQASSAEDFETASAYRNRLENLDLLTRHLYQPEEYLYNLDLAEAIRDRETADLATLLKNYFPQISTLPRIECYDISNLSGKNATGSMVTFQKGIPDKRYYRRFRIRAEEAPNDYLMIREVISRRLKHPQWPLPDLFVVDGGKPQFLAMQKELAAQNIQKPLVGLAKAYEELVLVANGKFIKVRLPPQSPALHLIQRLRDEAHRFAHNYHTMLRLKSLFA
ncbi:GIY-YIG nuclease family protein [Candidatus Microgenomates bacterium]|nr:GIY-YIG nuclease family protein [Candidatus Microgenomates bacterium]